MIRLAAVLLLCLSAFGQTTYTSVAAGGTLNVNDNATWVGGTAPPTGCPAAPGFKVVIANGTNLNVPAGVTFCPGASDGTDAIACSSGTGTGSMTIAGTLQYRGNVKTCNAAWHVSADAYLVADSSQAATPSTANYTFGAQSSNQTAGVIYFDGAVDNSSVVCPPVAGVSPAAGCHPVTITIAPGSGNSGGITSGAQDGGQIVGQYFTVDHCGVGTSGNCMVATMNSANTLFDIHHAYFTNSGRVGVANVHGSSTARIHHLSINSPVSSTALAIGVGGSSIPAKTTGTREIHHVYYDGGSFSSNITGISNFGFAVYEVVGRAVETVNVLSSSHLTSPANSGQYVPGEWHDNAIWQRTTSTGFQPGLQTGDFGPTLWLYDRVGETCSWGDSLTPSITHTMTAPGFRFVMDGWVNETRCGSISNKGVQIANNGRASADYDVIVKNSLWLPGSNGIGFLEPTLGVSNLTCNGTTTFCSHTQFINNTVAVVSAGAGNSPCGVGNEAFPVAANSIAAVHSNIWWSPAAVTGCITATIDLAAIGQDTAGYYGTPVDHNWTYNLTGQYSAPTPFYRFGSTGIYTELPGAHDQSGNPGFFNHTPGATTVTYRNFLGWCQSVNGSDASWSDCWAHFADLHSQAHDTKYNVAAALAWIKAGYYQRNPLTWTAGQSGGRVGAMRVLGISPDGGSGW